MARKTKDDEMRSRYDFSRGVRGKYAARYAEAANVIVLAPDEADGVLPQAIRTAELRVRLPRHHIDMLEYRQTSRRPRSAGCSPRELDGIASAHIEELSSALPGFAEAMTWLG
jgi:hypothetical protein